jgi:hypothetical protein
VTRYPEETIAALVCHAVTTGDKNEHVALAAAEAWTMLEEGGLDPRAVGDLVLSSAADVALTRRSPRAEFVGLSPLRAEGEDALEERAHQGDPYVVRCPHCDEALGWLAGDTMFLPGSLLPDRAGVYRFRTIAKWANERDTLRSATARRPSIFR